MSTSAVTSEASIQNQKTHHKREIKIQHIDSVKEFLTPILEKIPTLLNSLVEEYKKGIIQINKIKKQKELEKLKEIEIKKEDNYYIKEEPYIQSYLQNYEMYNKYDDNIYIDNYDNRNYLDVNYQHTTTNKNEDEEFKKVFSNQPMAFDEGKDESCVFLNKHNNIKNNETQLLQNIKMSIYENNDYNLYPYNVDEVFTNEGILDLVNQIITKIFSISEKLRMNNIATKDLFTTSKKTYLILNESKKRIICDIVNDYGAKETAKYLNLSIKSLKRWMKSGIKRKKGGGRKILDPLMEKKLIIWFNEQKKMGKKITAKNIKQMAKRLSSNKSFLASKGWFEKFRKKTKIHPDTHVKLVDKLDFDNDNIYNSV